MICCRHVLEHLPTPGSLLETVRRSLDGRPGCILFFEVPNAMYTVKDMGIWDLIYEHCSYFTIDSLAYLFQSYGFGVKRLTEEFEGQFLGIDGVTGTDSPSPAVPPDTVQAEGSDIERYISAFAKNYAAKIVDMETLLERNRPHSHRTVIWGAGSKGVTFSNLYNLQDDIPYIVDINEQKQGMYVPGTGQRVVGPAFLQEFRPETVLVMNPAYLQEIQGICHDLSVSPELIAV
jgi:hypothetical protein